MLCAVPHLTQAEARAKGTGIGSQHILQAPPCSPGNTQHLSLRLHTTLPTAWDKTEEEPKEGKRHGTQTKSLSSYAAHEVTSVAIEQPEQQAQLLLAV